MTATAKGVICNNFNGKCAERNLVLKGLWEKRA